MSLAVGLLALALAIVWLIADYREQSRRRCARRHPARRDPLTHVRRIPRDGGDQ